MKYQSVLKWLIPLIFVLALFAAGARRGQTRGGNKKNCSRRYTAKAHLDLLDSTDPRGGARSRNGCGLPWGPPSDSAKPEEGTESGLTKSMCSRPRRKRRR